MLLVFLQVFAPADPRCALVLDVYEKEGASLKAFIYRYVRDNSAAEDLLQETILRLLQYVYNIEGFTYDSAVRYTMVAARNLSFDYLRKIRREADSEVWEDQNADDSAQLDFEYSDLRDMVRAIMKELSPRDAELLEAHYISELSLEEIAALQNIKLPTLYTRMSRAKSRVRKLARKHVEALDEFRQKDRA